MEEDFDAVGEPVADVLQLEAGEEGQDAGEMLEVVAEAFPFVHDVAAVLGAHHWDISLRVQLGIFSTETLREGVFAVGLSFGTTWRLSFPRQGCALLRSVAAWFFLSAEGVWSGIFVQTSLTSAMLVVVEPVAELLASIGCFPEQNVTRGGFDGWRCSEIFDGFSHDIAVVHLLVFLTGITLLKDESAAWRRFVLIKSFFARHFR